MIVFTVLATHFCVSYSQTTTSLNLAWDPSAGSVSGYYVYVQNLATSQTTKLDAGNSTSAVIGSLVAGQSYKFYVTAYDSSRVESVPSNIVNYTVPGPPSAPSSLALTPLSSQSTRISWTDNSANETGFTVWRKMDAGSYAQIASVSAGVTTFTDNAVIPGP